MKNQFLDLIYSFFHNIENAEDLTDIDLNASPTSIEFEATLVMHYENEEDITDIDFLRQMKEDLYLLLRILFNNVEIYYYPFKSRLVINVEGMIRNEPIHYEVIPEDYGC